MEQGKAAVVLLSGGLDSATTLAVARHQRFACHALSFDYGQRHRFELEAARRVAAAMGAASHHVVRIDLTAAGGFGASALHLLQKTFDILGLKNAVNTPLQLLELPLFLDPDGSLLETHLSAPALNQTLEPMTRIELVTSPLPRECSTN